MNWINAINEYTPYNEQELQDKKVMLEYISQFDDLLTRDNRFAHMTASSFAINKDRDKCLMIFHNIYDTWAWTGGHADGMEDMYQVAMKELKEETGVQSVNPIHKDIISLDIIPVYGHIKNGQYVSAHLHLNISYLFECDDMEELHIKEDENSGVQWISIDEIPLYSNEDELIKIYDKIIARIRELG